MVGIRIGNQKLEDITKHLGIELSQEHYEYLAPLRVDNADVPEGNYWHCFELPSYSIHCGSRELAEMFKLILTNYSLKNTIHLTFDFAESDYLTYGLDLTEPSGFKKFIYAVDFFGVVQFYKLTKINDKSLVYESVDSKSKEESYTRSHYAPTNNLLEKDDVNYKRINIKKEQHGRLSRGLTITHGYSELKLYGYNKGTITSTLKSNWKGVNERYSLTETNH